MIATKCSRCHSCAENLLSHNEQAVFMDWFEFDLLSVVPPGHTVIMDNASFHPKKELYKMADRYSVNLLFLPPYSPGFNPIEKFLANLKRRLRDFLCFYDSLHAALYDRLVLFLS